VSERGLVIAQVNTREQRGGAETIARQLVKGYRRRGHQAWLLVGREDASAEGVLPFPSGLRAETAHLLAGPLRLLDRRRGLETYRYPKTGRMLEGLPAKPDVVHLHNLHGGYFDLRVLPDLSRRLAVFLTLHDAWLLSGHCAHSFDCERWRTGCGSCPDLTIYPAVRKDATAGNWQRKRDIFRRSRFHVATPSQWLADRVSASILAPALEQLRVIPNGIDLRTFNPSGREAARARLGLDADQPVLLIAGNDAGTNPFKDFPTARRAAVGAAERSGRDVTVFVLGDTGAEAREGGARFRPVPWRQDPAEVAVYVRAADVYLHASRADTFPTSVIEAMACGTPVVATAVGGIPEQLDDTSSRAAASGAASVVAIRATGMLVPPGDAEAMASATAALLDDGELRRTMGANAARRAARRFDAERQCEAYLDWYRAVVSSGSSPAVSQKGTSTA
jgi:glycosyltransferase involved in cell wall biosynthesis